MNPYLFSPTIQNLTSLLRRNDGYLYKITKEEIYILNQLHLYIIRVIIANFRCQIRDKIRKE